LQGAVFIKVLRTPGNVIVSEYDKLDYGNFPYVPLRVVDSIFGVLLALALYFFMRSQEVGRVGSVLAAFFVTIDNAILLNTRLILLDGMLLFFGIAALALYFGAAKRRRPVLSGFVWGLCLAEKLTGIVFAGPVIIALLMAPRGELKRELKKILQFGLAGFATLALVWCAGSLMFSPSARIAALSQITPITGLPPAAWQAEHPVAMYALADIFELSFSTNNYLNGPQNYENGSPWYFWPADQIPMYFGYGLSLDGNPVTWFGVTLAVALAFSLSFRYLKDRYKGVARRQPFFIFLGGYLAAMLPFLTVVRRNTFLYHYFPALLFGFALLAWFIAEEWLKVREWGDFTTRKALIFSAVLVLAIGGFLFLLPGTYGF
jgi:dolichyl-phosphate-mannose-protein mannosyltransferase